MGVFYLFGNKSNVSHGHQGGGDIKHVKKCSRDVYRWAKMDAFNEEGATVSLLKKIIQWMKMTLIFGREYNIIIKSNITTPDFFRTRTENYWGVTKEQTMLQITPNIQNFILKICPTWSILFNTSRNNNFRKISVH